jgi:hypothetical protein
MKIVTPKQAAIFLVSAGIAVQGGCASGPSPESRRANSLLDGGLVILAPAGLLLASFDRDGDAKVSASELEAGIERSFKLADADANGILRRLELDAWRERVLGDVGRTPAGAAFDTDFDGLISAQEFGQALRDTASRIDANQDGVVEFGELAFDRGLLDMPSRSRGEDRDPLTRPPPG